MTDRKKQVMALPLLRTQESYESFDDVEVP